MKKSKKITFLILLTSLSLCSCGQNKEEPTPEPTPSHEHNFIESVVEPTCEEGGYTLHSCTECDYCYKTDEVSKTGHKYKLYNAKSPTFEEDGCKKHYECETCGAYFNMLRVKVDKSEVIIHVELLDYQDEEDPIYLMRGDLTIDFDFEGYFLCMSSFENVKALVSQGTTAYSFFVEYINTLKEYGSSATKNYMNAEILAYANPSQENVTLRDTLYEAQNKTSVYCNQLTLLLLKSPVYKYDAMPGYSDQQIADYVKSLEESKTDEISELSIEINQIVSGYHTGKIAPYDAVSAFVKKSNDFAEYYGYDNYLKFCWRNVYGRDYSIDDTSLIFDYIADYIKPSYEYAYSLHADLYSHVYSDETYKEAYEKSHKLSNAFFGCNMTNLREYAAFLSGKYNYNFNNFILNGNYFLSNIPNNNITAYVSYLNNGTPYMFMGKDYQNLSTFVHEFGHYNAFLTFYGTFSYDLAETQSQGNEMLFYSYLAQNKLDALTARFFLSEQLYSMLNTILIGYAVNELERYIYVNEDFTKEEIEAKWISIGNSLGFDFSYFFDYMYLVLMNYQGYYISYAMSAIAALEIYAKSITSLETAKDSYISIYTLDGYSEGFNKSLENAGLYKVSEEAAYQMIAQAVNAL